MGNNEIDVVDYVRKLQADKSFLATEYKKYVNNCYSIDNIDGTIPSDVLCSLIKAAKANRKLRMLLGELLWYVDGHSVTDSIFRMLLAFPSWYRNTYTSVLGHKNLAFYQMQILNRYPQSFEAFSWLFDHICCYDCFTDKDMYKILSENCDTTKYGIQRCIDSASEKYGGSKKLSLAIEWNKKM